MTENFDRGTQRLNLNISPPRRPIRVRFFFNSSSDLPLPIARLKPPKPIIMPEQPTRREWTEFERGMVWGCWLALEKKGIRKVAELTGIPKTTCGVIIKKYEEEGVTRPPPRQGRQRAMTERDERHLKITVEKNPLTPLPVIQQEFCEASGTTVSVSTLRRTLPLLGYHACAGSRKPWISPVNQTIRQRWCRARSEWDEEWKTVIWSDESRFKLFRSDGRVWTWRKVGYRYHTNHLIPTVKHGGGGVMVWSCFSWKGLGPLIIVEGNMNGEKYREMLSEVKKTMEQLYGDLGGLLFQQDNAPCHKARKAMRWFEDENVPLLPWPAQSPDLNPIEPLWDELDRRIRKRKPLPANLTELKAALREEWEQIPRTVYEKLILSMGKRVAAVIEAKGAPTRY